MIFYGKKINLIILVPNATVGFNWNPDSPSYGLDLAFAACEWCVGLAFVSYFLTLYPDFKVIYYTIFI